MLGNVELGQDIFVDSGLRADDIDTQVLPGDTKFLRLESGGQVSLVLLLDLPQQTPIVVLAVGGAALLRSLIPEDGGSTFCFILDINRPLVGRRVLVRSLHD